MNDLVTINDWLRNPNRSFSDGIAIRNKYKINNNLDAFFAKADPESIEFGVAVGMLVQEITKIHIKLINNPKLLEVKAAETIASKQAISTSQTPSRSARVTIETDKVKKEDLPDALKPIFDRIQEITPILGAKHANLKAENDEEKAKVLAEEVVTLDSEKRELWAKIDSWYKSKNITLVVTQDATDTDQQPVTPFERIMAIEDTQLRLKEIIKREKLLKDDIVRSKNKLEEFKKNKPHLVEQKQKSIAEKEQEHKLLHNARTAIEGSK